MNSESIILNISVSRTPAITIILPVYNGDRYLEKAILSVLDQDYKNFELLIIDDGSTDTSETIIKKIISETNDDRIKFIKNEKNIGLIATLNKGLSLSESPYIGRIDSDDSWHRKDKLSLQIDYLEKNPETFVVGTWAHIIDENDKPLFDLRTPVTDRELRNRFLLGNQIIHPSTVFRRSKALEVGGFIEGEKYVEDYSLWLRLGEIGMLYNFPEFLMTYRVHANSATQKNNVEQLRNKLILIKKHRNTYPNYMRGFIVSNIKLFILKFIGINTINKIKSLSK